MIKLKSDIATVETIDQCKKEYLPPVEKYISCSEFGHMDGMCGSCHWCLEMTPYQWYMCSDKGDFDRIKAKNPEYTDKDIAKQIEARKKRDYTKYWKLIDLQYQVKNYWANICLNNDNWNGFTEKENKNLFNRFNAELDTIQSKLIKLYNMAIEEGAENG
jgi:hypothetical protein